MEQHIELETLTQLHHRVSQILEDIELSEISKFHQQVVALLERDYYNSASCPGIPAAITLPCIPALVMPILFFWELLAVQTQLQSLHITLL